MKRIDSKGSMMLEAVLVLPIFILIIFLLIQLTFVWVAQQVTYYAAYCGARAALVYNPADYGAREQDDGSWDTEGWIRTGVVHHVACTALSWISWSLDGMDFMNFRIGTYGVPLSSNIRRQVSVQITEFEKIKDKKNNKESEKEDETPAKIDDHFPSVKVTVSFKCPLFSPLGAPVVAYFFALNRIKMSPALTGQEPIGIRGFTAPHGDAADTWLLATGNYHNPKSERQKNSRKSKFEYYSIELTESCTLAKPYKTDTFPVIPEKSKRW